VALIDGVKIVLAGTEYTVPPINLRLYFKLETDIAKLSNPAETPLVDYMRAAVVVLLAVMQRNYPDMTADKLEDEIDFAALPVVVKAIFGQSGFESRPLVETVKPKSRSAAAT
jgi:hypothetical protein